MNEQKQLVAGVLAQRVQDGEVIGFGSGSTTEIAIAKIAERVAKESLNLACLATSLRTAQVASSAGIRVLSGAGVHSLDWCFDGADEVDPQFNMIKGRGAAMLSEKIVARKSKDIVILVSEDKLVEKLGEHFAVPVEVIPEAVGIVEHALATLGARATELREAEKKYGPVVTEHGNLIIDAKFEDISDNLEQAINSITGVVENGLFINFQPEVILARGSEVFSRKLSGGKLVETKLSL